MKLTFNVNDHLKDRPRKWAKRQHILALLLIAVFVI